jgi:hypothetical protein
MGEPLASLSQEADSYSGMQLQEPLQEEAIEETYELPEAAMEPPMAAIEEPVPASPGATLNEDQIRAMLQQVSREVIEKIVWEVVPDLAETLIREEIRKLKEGMN